MLFRSLADFIAKQFSQKGIVSQNLLGKYIKTLTDAASKAEAETGIRVIFKNDNGISISYCINGDVDTENGRDYETLSEGEKMLAFLTVTDLLHRIANIPVLLLDNVDKLDAENFDHLLTLLDRVADSNSNKNFLADSPPPDRKSTRLNSSHNVISRMPSSA